MFPIETRCVTHIASYNPIGNLFTTVSQGRMYDVPDIGVRSAVKNMSSYAPSQRLIASVRCTLVLKVCFPSDCPIFHFAVCVLACFRDFTTCFSVFFILDLRTVNDDNTLD